MCKACYDELGNMPKFRRDVEAKHIGTDKLEELELLARRGVGHKVDKERVKEELKEKLRVLEL